LIPRFNPAFSVSKVRSVLQWLLFIVLAWLAGELVANQLSSVQSPSLPVLKKASQAANVNGQPSFLFGDFKAALDQESEAKANLGALKETRLNLKLVGVIDYPNRGLALVQRGAKSEVYGVGDEIQSGVTLLNVLGDQAIILNRGVQERLVLEGVNNQLLQSSNASQVRNAGKASSQPARLTEIGRQLKRSPMSISQYLRFEPINQGGQWVAVKIWSKSDQTLFRSLGFEEGDRVTLINGKTIDEMAKNPALWREFLNENKMDLTVERNGVPETVAVQFGS
jgi:Type II secretory pathway, component PulC